MVLRRLGCSARRLSESIGQHTRMARFRDPDAVKGGTWEAFERILQRHGHFRTGLRKVEAARMISARLDPDRNRSRSFAAFRDVVVEATT